MIGASVYSSILTTTDVCLDPRLKTRRSRREAVDRAPNSHNPAPSLRQGRLNRSQDVYTLSRLRRTSGGGWKGWLRSERINGVELEIECTPESRDRANAVDAGIGAFAALLLAVDGSELFSSKNNSPGKRGWLETKMSLICSTYCFHHQTRLFLCCCDRRLREGQAFARRSCLSDSF